MNARILYLAAYAVSLALGGAVYLFGGASKWGSVESHLLSAGFGLLSARASARFVRAFLDRQPPGLPPRPAQAVRAFAHLLTLDLAALGLLLLIRRRGEAAVGAFVAAGAGLLGVGLILEAAASVLAPPEHYRRGRRLLAAKEAVVLAARARKRGDAGLPWGGVRIPSDSASAHFAVVGATGSGKTTTLRLLMQEVLPAIAEGTGRRAVVYDAKQDTASLLAGMGLRCPVHLLHPLDARGLAWDLARDCNSPATALQVASVLIPVEEGPNRFFSDAARDLLAGVLVALDRLSPGLWTLRDVLCAAKDKRRLHQLLSQAPEAGDRLQYFDEERTFQNVYSTLRSRTAWFEPVAACWDRAKGRISLADWIRGESILVLGNDEAIRTPLDAINRVLFQRLVELLLAQPETLGVRTYLFLDEVRDAGKLDGLGRLLTKGRSKGCAAVLGFQDVDGLREVYGERAANELVGQCGNKAILRLESPATAEWASQVLGEQEIYDRSRSETAAGLERPSGTLTEQLVRKPAVLPSEFFGLPKAGPANGIVGYHLASSLGAYRSRVGWPEIQRTLRGRSKSVPDFVSRRVEDQYLRPWDEEDLKRLGLGSPSSDEKAVGGRDGSGENAVETGAAAQLQVIGARPSR